MNDGYWDSTVLLCTEGFTKREVECLKALLLAKFGIVSGTKKRKEKTSLMGGVRLRLSGTKKIWNWFFLWYILTCTKICCLNLVHIETKTNKIMGTIVLIMEGPRKILLYAGTALFFHTYFLFYFFYCFLF